MNLINLRALQEGAPIRRKPELRFRGGAQHIDAGLAEQKLFVNALADLRGMLVCGRAAAGALGAGGAGTASLGSVSAASTTGSPFTINITLPLYCANGVGVPLMASMVNSWTLDAAKAVVDSSRVAKRCRMLSVYRQDR